MKPHRSPRRNCALLLLVLVLCSIVPRAFPQGPLTPPPGVPVPTMKTLDQVEARTPIAGATTTVTIATDGSYYLTGNIVVATGNGITITAKNVTLDLNGFAIISTATTVDNFATGISYSSSSGSVAIYNGHIRSGTTYNSGAGTFAKAGFAFGIFVSAAGAVRVADVEVIGVSSYGMRVDAGSAVVSRCQVNIAGSEGIADFLPSISTVDHCNVLNCNFAGIQASNVSDSVATSVNGTGIIADTATNCTGAGTMDGVRVTNAFNCKGTATGNGLGLHATATATGCSGTSHGSFGLQADTATNCSGTSTFDAGLKATTARGCVGSSQSGIGVSADNAEGCTGSSTSGVGLYALTASNCRGTSAGAAYGLQADNTATNCFGQSNTGNGLRTPTATSCFGQSSAGTGAAALFAITATTCRGFQTTGAGEAIHTDIAVSCTSQGGGITSTVARYLMP